MGVGIKGFGGSGSGSGPTLKGLGALPPAAVAAANIFADITPPTVSITSPIADAIVSDTISVTADASDDSAVSQVEFFANAVSIGVDTDAPYSVNWDTTSIADGSVTLTAVATDTSNNETTSTGVSVTVGNVEDLILIGQNIVSTSGSTLSFPAGTTAGDLGIVLFVNGPSTITTISGWSLKDSAAGVLTGSSYSIYSKTLVQADLDSPVSFVTSLGGYNLVIYRNHNNITFKQQSLLANVSGFTKAVDSARIIAFFVDRDPVISTDPVNFTEINNSNITYFNMASSDILSAEYDEGSITWTPGPGGFGHAISVLEITV